IVSCGPQPMNIGKRERSMIPTAVRRLAGHLDGGPTAVSDQSRAPINPAISPPPRNNGSSPTPASERGGSPISPTTAHRPEDHRGRSTHGGRRTHDEPRWRGCPMTDERGPALTAPSSHVSPPDPS